MTHDSQISRLSNLEKAAQAPLSLKQMLAYQIEREMAHQHISRVRMAELMQTSRAVLNRLLDPINPSVTLQTIQKAADVLGHDWHIFLKEK
jgi:hypothetical protein